MTNRQAVQGGQAATGFNAGRSGARQPGRAFFAFFLFTQKKEGRPHPAGETRTT
jgi:hypothetical protein